jgi:hypothetical protein
VEEGDYQTLPTLIKHAICMQNKSETFFYCLHHYRPDDGWQLAPLKFGQNLPTTWRKTFNAMRT